MWATSRRWGNLNVLRADWVLPTQHPVLVDMPEHVGTSSHWLGAADEDGRQDGGLQLGDEPVVLGGLGIAQPASYVPVSAMHLQTSVAPFMKRLFIFNLGLLLGVGEGKLDTISVSSLE